MGHWDPPLEPWPGGGTCGQAADGRVCTPGPGRAKKSNVGPPHPMDLPPVGGAKGVGCFVNWAMAKGGDFGGLIPIS